MRDLSGGMTICRARGSHSASHPPLAVPSCFAAFDLVLFGEPSDESELMRLQVFVVAHLIQTQELFEILDTLRTFLPRRWTFDAVRSFVSYTGVVHLGVEAPV